MQNLRLKAQVNIADFFNSPLDGSTVNPGEFITILLRNIISISAVVFTLLALGGGFAMIMGAGNDNPQQAAKGKQAVTAAVIGFVIIFTSFWIVQAIGILTGTQSSILSP